MEDNTNQTSVSHAGEPVIENYYGQFVAFNDNNELMCYSRNGKPIYYYENPPTTPVKNKLSNQNEVYIENNSIPKYKNVVDITSQNSYSIFRILYGILASCVFIIIFMSMYVLFFE